VHATDRSIGVVLSFTGPHGPNRHGGPHLWSRTRAALLQALGL